MRNTTLPGGAFHLVDIEAAAIPSAYPRSAIGRELREAALDLLFHARKGQFGGTNSAGVVVVNAHAVRLWQTAEAVDALADQARPRTAREQEGDDRRLSFVRRQAMRLARWLARVASPARQVVG